MMRMHLRFLAYIILAIASFNAWSGAYEDFFRAVNTDDASTVEKLLARGFDPNSVDERGHVGLFIAAREDSPKVFEVLLSHPQVQVDITNAAGETPAMMAALHGRAAWVGKLLQRGAQVNREGWSPLHYAACAADTAALDLLLQRGASTEVRSPNQTTPLMMAAMYGPEEAVEKLLAKGADPSARNVQQMTAADFAARVGRESLSKRLAALLR